MPRISITKEWGTGITSSETHLDNIKNGCETFFNTTKLDSDNFQSEGIAAASLASTSVTTTKLADAAVTTPSINDAAVTQAKRAAVTQSTSSAEILEWTAPSITTTGRPVFIGIVPNLDNPHDYLTIYMNGVQTATDIAAYINIYRSSTLIGKTKLNRVVPSASNSLTVEIPPSTWIIDTPSGGAYTYSASISVDSLAYTGESSGVKLTVYEL